MPLFDIPKPKSMLEPSNWDGKYNIIYADPPWKYDDCTRPGGAARKYDVMDIDDIKQMPIQNIAADDCVLFMWACYPMIQEALDLIKAWGFTYKTIAFQWIKTTTNGNIFWGLGNWTRANSEPCLLAVKGKPKPKSHGINQIIMSSIRKHSQKPDIVRDKIVELCGDLPRIELFARQHANGWHAFGNEIESDIRL